MRRVVALAILIAGCGKEEPAPSALPAPTFEGLWLLADGTEVEFASDGGLVWSWRRGTWRRVDGGVEISWSDGRRETFEIAFNGDRMYLFDDRLRATRLERGIPSPEVRESRKKRDCALHLTQLWKMQNVYMVQYGGPRKLMPSETGGAFWLKLSKPPTALIDATLEEFYHCPFRQGPSGTTDYRGPNGDVNRFGDGDPVGACIGHHPDGSATVLRKSGDVLTVEKDDAFFKLALEKTAP